ncbi:hypothetical protein CsSME_00038725 [Camellia sinensis var. sinensis]
MLIQLLIFFLLGEVICEDLPTNVCSFSIASSGKRCLLENYATKDGKVEYQCRTSEVVVERMAEYIETDQCVSACGVDRSSVGISSDSLLEPQFTAKLCCPNCYQNCPNIVDLYFNLAAGEGKQKKNHQKQKIVAKIFLCNYNTLLTTNFMHFLKQITLIICVF